MDDDLIRIGDEKHPKPNQVVLCYGTAGFRARANVLDHALFRCGILASLRSKMLKKVIGVMVTASHNPVEDNGTKLVDPMGEMLPVDWENCATEIVNCDELVVEVKKLCRSWNIDLSRKSHVIVARDTRPSSQSLCQAVIDGVIAVGSEVRYCQVLTTPQLHFMVRCTNGDSYGTPSEAGYFEKLCTAFAVLQKKVKHNQHYEAQVQVDDANGVGASKLSELSDRLRDLLSIKILKTKSQELNDLCGANFVKEQQRSPVGVVLSEGCKMASFDGDADRIVYFTQIGGQFCLLDGDKIACLVAMFLKQKLQTACLEVSMGVVQTAYANGAATHFVSTQLGLPVVCVATGVKHLHKSAAQFDVGIYFEANGHGTILFSDKLKQQLKSLPSAEYSEILSLIDVINETVGDAMSILLLVEVILAHLDWSPVQWAQIYRDRPNKQRKVSVKDRLVLKMTPNEVQLIEPSGLQLAINQAVLQFNNARSFVRPSGTEDVVRVYAEAETQEEADRLALDVSVLVYDTVQGTGTRPQL